MAISRGSVVTAVANLKGGVGKTTSTNGLAHAGASQGRRVLIVDADMQGNITEALTGIKADHDDQPISLADVLDRDSTVVARDAIMGTRREGIDIIPSGFATLQAVQDNLVGKTGGEMAFSKAIRTVRDDYDHILIDCRPAIDLVSRSALYAADNVLIVVQPESFSTSGLSSIVRTLDEIEEFMDRHVPAAGMLVNQRDLRREDHTEIIEHLRVYADQAGIPLLGAPIPLKADIARLTAVGMGIDEMPRNPVWSRVVHDNYITILEGLTK